MHVIGRWHYGSSLDNLSSKKFVWGKIEFDLMSVSNKQSRLIDHDQQNNKRYQFSGLSVTNHQQ
jgi:hypothetical protein